MIAMARNSSNQALRPSRRDAIWSADSWPSCLAGNLRAARRGAGGRAVGGRGATRGDDMFP